MPAYAPSSQSVMKSQTHNHPKTKALDLKDGETLLSQVLSTDHLPSVEKNFHSMNFDLR
jgi:hypothetical protein